VGLDGKIERQCSGVILDTLEGSHANNAKVRNATEGKERAVTQENKKGR
jgi:hypothetical protein